MSQTKTSTATAGLGEFKVVSAAGGTQIFAASSGNAPYVMARWIS